MLTLPHCPALEQCTGPGAEAGATHRHTTRALAAGGASVTLCFTLDRFTCQENGSCVTCFLQEAYT